MEMSLSLIFNNLLNSISSIAFRLIEFFDLVDLVVITGLSQEIVRDSSFSQSKFYDSSYSDDGTYYMSSFNCPFNRRRLFLLLRVGSPPFFSLIFSSILAFNTCFFFRGQFSALQQRCSHLKHSLLINFPQHGHSLVARFYSPSEVLTSLSFLRKYLSLFLSRWSLFMVKSISFIFVRMFYSFNIYSF